MEENYYIIHGSFGSPYSNWFGWLHDYIESEAKQVYVPDFPVGVGYQNYENWSKLLKVYLDLGLINENTIIILKGAGHINSESGFDTFEDILSYIF